MRSLVPQAGTPPEGLYLHVPFCDGKCAYCAFYSVPGSEARFAAYVEAVLGEAAQLHRAYPCFRPATVYVGGGTPSMLPLPQWRQLLGGLSATLLPRRVVEWTVEVNPGSVSAPLLEYFRHAGVTRISMGVQSFSPRVLRGLGRRHTVADIHRSWARVREAGFRRTSLDLIACVPGETLREWERTLAAAVTLDPEHVSVYALTTEEGSRLAAEHQARRFKPLGDLAQLRRLARAVEVLRAGGYRQYEISNFARPGGECRHNVACWRGGRYLGLGPAAASFMGTSRWTNAADLDAYLSALKAGQRPPRESERIGAAREALDRVVFGLRENRGIDLAEIGDATGASERLCRRVGARLEDLRMQGLVERRAGRWCLSARGRELADHVAVEILP